MSAPSSEDRRQQIEKMAYELWESRGRPLGSPAEDWFAAENALSKRELAQAGSSSMSEAPGSELATQRLKRRSAFGD